MLELGTYKQVSENVSLLFSPHLDFSGSNECLIPYNELISCSK